MNFSIIEFGDKKPALSLPPFNEVDLCEEVVAYLEREIYSHLESVLLTKSISLKSSLLEVARGILSLYKQLALSQIKFARASLGQRYYLEVAGEEQLECQLFEDQQPLYSAFTISKKELLSHIDSLWLKHRESTQEQLKTVNPVLAEVWSAQTADVNLLEELNKGQKTSPVQIPEDFLAALETLTATPLPDSELFQQLTVKDFFAYTRVEPQMELSFGQRKLVWLQKASLNKAQPAVFICLEGSRLLILIQVDGIQGQFEEYIQDSHPLWSPHSIAKRLQFFWNYWSSFKDGLSLEDGILSPTQEVHSHAIKRLNSPLVLKAVESSEKFEIKPNSIQRIGRDKACEIVLTSPMIGRKQAVFKFQGGRCTVEDAGSPSGTYVNGQQVRSATILKRGDQLQLGGLVFKVE